MPAVLGGRQGQQCPACGSNVICATLARPDISSASLAAAIATPTLDTCGLSFPGSFANAMLQSSLASRLRVLTEGCGSTLYRLTYGSHPMVLQEPIFALRASARPTSGNDCGGLESGWPTPAARLAVGSLADDGRGTVRLEGQTAAQGVPSDGLADADGRHPAQKGYNEAGNNDSSRRTVALGAG